MASKIRNYWQIAAGARGRNYASNFLDTGMAFVGGDQQIQTMEHVQHGDVIVLKSGLTQILAVGEVVQRGDSHRGCGDKNWLRDFDGWELPAYCYVDWRVPQEPVQTSGLTRSTIQQMPQEHHRVLADEIMLGEVHQGRGEPDSTEEVTDEEILVYLVSEGLRPEAAEQLTSTFNKVRRLATYYYDNCDWEVVREHETRSFLVLPLLLALGWSEQRLKVEFPVSRGRVDIAGFTGPYHRATSECSHVIETKDFATGLDYAPDQARGYAKHLPSCRVLVVTNGQCFKAYRRSSGKDFSTVPSAYLNIKRPTRKYALNPKNVGGALELFACLMP